MNSINNIKRVFRIILCVLIVLIFSVYVLFRGFINFYLPFNTYIAEYIAKSYVSSNIGNDFKQIGKVKKEIYNGSYIISFGSLDNNLFFKVYVDSTNFEVFKNTFQESFINEYFHNKLDSVFYEDFEENARYEIVLKTINNKEFIQEYKHISVKNIGKYIENLKVNVHINILNETEYKKYNIKASNFIKDVKKNLTDINISQVTLLFYKSSNITPQYSYEVKLNDF